MKVSNAAEVAAIFPPMRPAKHRCFPAASPTTAEPDVSACIPSLDKPMENVSSVPMLFLKQLLLLQLIHELDYVNHLKRKDGKL